MTLGPVRITQSLSGNSSFARSVETVAALAVAKKLLAVVHEAEAEAKRIVSSELNTNRPPLRRKKGARHLLEGIAVEVKFPNGINTFPIEIVGKVIGDQHKTGALEFGSPRHDITPRNVEFLRFPASGEGKSTRKQRTARAGLAANNRLSRVNLIKSTKVDHPGNRGHHFLERGIRQAIAAAFG